VPAEKERPQVPEISYPTDHFGNSNYADVSETPASAAQGEQVGMKKAKHRPSGHALPFE
jgi:hypothetical protein